MSLKQVQKHAEFMEDTYKLLFNVNSNSTAPLVSLDPKTGIYLDANRKYAYYIAHNAPFKNGHRQAILVGIAVIRNGNLVKIKYLDGIVNEIKTELNSCITSSFYH